MISGGLRKSSIFKQSQENKPLITVVTVVRNGEKTLEETIQSVINQTYKNIEYIIIDGGSTDSTLDIIKKYEKKIDYWISEPDKGIYDAMNKGISIASGDYISLLNSDDYYELNTCEIIVNNINKTNADIYYGMMRIIDHYNKVIYIYGWTVNMLHQYMIAHQTCFIKKDIYKVFKYSTNYISSGDYEYMLRLNKNKRKFYFIESILANYRTGGRSDSKIGKIETINIKKKYHLINTFKYLLKLIYLYIFN